MLFAVIMASATHEHVVCRPPKKRIVLGLMQIVTQDFFTLRQSLALALSTGSGNFITKTLLAHLACLLHERAYPGQVPGDINAPNGFYCRFVFVRKMKTRRASTTNTTMRVTTRESHANRFRCERAGARTWRVNVIKPTTGSQEKTSLV